MLKAQPFVIPSGAATAAEARNRNRPGREGLPARDECDSSPPRLRRSARNDGGRSVLALSASTTRAQENRAPVRRRRTPPLQRVRSEARHHRRRRHVRGRPGRHSRDADARATVGGQGPRRPHQDHRALGVVDRPDPHGCAPLPRSARAACSPGVVKSRSSSFPRSSVGRAATARAVRARQRPRSTSCPSSTTCEPWRSKNDTVDTLERHYNAATEPDRRARR